MPDGFKFSKSAYDQTSNNIYYCLDRVNQQYELGVRSASLRGYMATNDAVYKDVTVTGQETCKRVGYQNWAESGSFTLQGYVSATKVWTSNWRWSN